MDAAYASAGPPFYMRPGGMSTLLTYILEPEVCIAVNNNLKYFFFIENIYATCVLFANMTSGDFSKVKTATTMTHDN